MNRKMSDYWNMGTAIGFCAALGILVGALLNSLVLWLTIGAGIGVLVGAASYLHMQKRS